MQHQRISCPRCRRLTLDVIDDGEAVRVSCTDDQCGYSDAAYWNGGAA